MAPVPRRPGGELGAPDAHGLQLQLEASLQALRDGRARVAGGDAAVRELRGRLAELGPRLGLDLREVQESIVEHAAMYARNPEVLGGMLHLVFCFDLVRTWLSERDENARGFEVRLSALEGHFDECKALLVDLDAEIKSCSERAAAFRLATELSRAAPGSRQQHRALQEKALHGEPWEPGLCAGGRGALGGCAGARQGPAGLAPGAAEAAEALQELRSENAELRAQLAAQQAPELQPQALHTQLNEPVHSLLESLQLLEPMLAALPVGAVPGMSEVQEEACEGYSRMRTALLEAARVPHSPAATLPGQGWRPGPWEPLSAPGGGEANAAAQEAGGAGPLGHSGVSGAWARQAVPRLDVHAAAARAAAQQQGLDSWRTSGTGGGSLSGRRSSFQAFAWGGPTAPAHGLAGPAGPVQPNRLA